MTSTTTTADGGVVTTTTTTGSLSLRPQARTRSARDRKCTRSLAHVMGSPGAGRRCNDDVDVDVRWPSDVHDNQRGEPTKKVRWGKRDG